MHLSSFFGLICLVLANLETQKSLQAQEHPLVSPLDSSFDKQVEWTLKHFNIPGLAVVVSYGDIYAKVGSETP